MKTNSNKPTNGVSRRFAPCSMALLAAVVAWTWVLNDAPLSGQQSVETRVVHALALEHQPARHALELIEPMLTDNGTVELKGEANTLVVRDRRSVVEEILLVLQDFDHEPRELDLEFFILRASKKGSESAVQERLPRELVDGLGKVFRFNNYELLAEGRLTTREGESVTYKLGRHFSLGFDVGTVLFDKRVKLRSFTLNTRAMRLTRELFRGEVNLWLGDPFVLGLAPSETSDESVVVAVTGRPAEPVPTLRLGED